MATFVGFSFHFAEVSDGQEALDYLRQTLGITNYMIVEGNGIYVPWGTKVKPDAARMWWYRNLHGSFGAFAYMCCHHVPPIHMEAFLQRRFRLTTERHAIYGVRPDIDLVSAERDLGCVAIPVGQPSAVLAPRSAALSVCPLASSSERVPSRTESVDDSVDNRGSWLMLAVSRDWGALQERGANYVLGDLIGQGTFSMVYSLANVGFGSERKVVKRLRDEESTRALMLNELLYLERCRTASAHVVQLLDVFAKGNPMQVQFVLERWGIALDAYLDLRTANGLGRSPRTHVHHIIEHISNGLGYLNNMRVAHCDLKLANILLQTFRRPLPEASASIEGYTWGVHCQVSDLGSTQQVVCLILCLEIISNCSGIPRRRPTASFSFIITS